MIRAFLLSLIVTTAIPLYGALSVVSQITNQQAVLTISGAVGPCTLEVSLSGTYSPVVRDVDPILYAASNIDTSRADTISHVNGDHIVTIGHPYNDRSLLAATLYHYRISACGSATGTFTTDNIAPGFTQSFPFPYNAANWAQRGNSYSLADLIAKTPIADAMTGAKITPLTSFEGLTWRSPGNFGAAGTAAFPYWAGGVGWTNPSGVLNGSSSTGSTSNGNPLDLYLSAAQEAQLSGAYENAWISNAITDFAVKLFGSGTHVNICLFTNPTDGCPGGTPLNVDMTSGSGYSQIVSTSADLDHPWPSTFPHAYFSGWPTGTKIALHNRHTSGVMTAVSGLVTVGGTVTYSNAFMDTVKPGQKIYVDPAGITSGSCVNNLCTVATAISANKVQLAEIINANAGTRWELLGWGIRITNANPGTTMNIGVAWKAAGVNQSDNTGPGHVRCPPGAGFTSGTTPSHEMWVCTMPAGAGVDEWWLISKNGVGTKPLHSNGPFPPDSFFTGLLGWDARDIPACSGFGYCGVSPKDARTWYMYGANKGGTTSMWTVKYVGDASETRDWNYTRLTGGDTPGTLYGQDNPTLSYDMLQWDVVIGFATPLITQILAYDPTYDISLYGTGFQLDGVGGDVAFFQNRYGGGQNLPAYLAVMNTTTKTITNLVNTASGIGWNSNGQFLGGGYTGVHNITTFPVANAPVEQATLWGVGQAYTRPASNITNGNPAIMTDVGHGFAIGTHPVISFFGGADGTGWETWRFRRFNSTVIDADTFSIDADSTSFNPYATPGNQIYASTDRHNVTFTFLHGGPWYVTPDAMLRCNDVGYTTGVCSSASYSSDLSLDWPIGSRLTCVDEVQTQDRCRYPGDWYNKPLVAPSNVTTCPSGNPFEAYGATGDQCYTIRVPHGGFCNVQPTAAEIAHPGWTCPWNSLYSHPWDPQPGQTFITDSNQGAYGEVHRIVSITSGSEAGGMDKWIVQRNAAGDKCVAPGPFPSFLCNNNVIQNQSARLWTATPNAGGIYGNNAAAYMANGSGPTRVIQSFGGFSHGDLAPCATSGTFLYGANAAFTDCLPLNSLFPAPPSATHSSGSPAFHGVPLNIGGGWQSYFSLVPGASYGQDMNIAGDNFGGGTLDLGTSLQPRDNISLGSNIYKIEVYGTPNKYSFPFGEAGGHLLLDVSSTATSLTSGPVSALSATPFSHCEPLKVNECYFGSDPTAVGTNGRHFAYVNIPMMYDPTNGGMTAQHWANSPWVAYDLPGAGALRQQDMSTSDTTGGRTRQVAYMQDIPGVARTYGDVFSIAEGSTSTPVTLTQDALFHGWLVNTPPYPTGTTSVANDVISKTISFPAGPRYARLHWGYSRIHGPAGAPSAFLCSTRNEKCNSNGTPYLYDSETPTVTDDCTSGCTRTIGFMAPNLAYYQMQRSTDGTTWTNTTDGSTASEIQPLLDSGLRIGPCNDVAYNTSSGIVVGSGGTGTLTLTVTDQTCTSINTSNQSWLTLTSATGGCSISAGTAPCTGNGTFTWTASLNAGLARSATIATDSGTATFTLSQAGAPPCSFLLSPTAQTYAVGGEGQIVSITASDSACPWTANYPDSWLMGPTSGTGSGSITINASPNLGPARTSTLTIGGVSFAATQAGGCTFLIAPSSFTYPVGGTGKLVTITASDSACGWTASYPDSWLTGPTSGSGSQVITVTAAVNTGPLRSSSPTIATQTYSASQNPSTTPPIIGVTTSPKVSFGSKVRIQ